MRTEIDTHLAYLALDAGAAVAPYLRAHVRNHTTFETKLDFHDPVTEHDRNVEAALQHLLFNAIPNSRALGEETGTVHLRADSVLPCPEVAPLPSSPRWQEAQRACSDLGERVRWIIDPIDGTANFAAGLPWFCTSIAVELDETLVAGAVVAPLLGDAWAADRRHAWHVDREGRTQTLDARGPRNAAEAVLVCYYPGVYSIQHCPEVAIRRESEMLQAHQTLRRTGAAALDLAHIASGWLGGMLGFSFGPWDVAAGGHILEVAGGTLEDDPAGTDVKHGLRPAVLASCADLDLPVARRVFHEVLSEKR